MELFSCQAVSDSFVTTWTVACQAPLSMGFPRQESFSRLSFSSPGNFLIKRLNPCLLNWQVGSLPLSHQGIPCLGMLYCYSEEWSASLWHKNKRIKLWNRIEDLLFINFYTHKDQVQWRVYSKMLKNIIFLGWNYEFSSLLFGLFFFKWCIKTHNKDILFLKNCLI